LGTAPEKREIWAGGGFFTLPGHVLYGGIPMAEGRLPDQAWKEKEKRREENFGVIIKELTHDHVPYRVKAAEALGRIGDLRAVEPLILALEDSAAEVRWVTARSLGMLGDRQAVKPLLKALEDEERWVRQGAAWALGEIRDPGAVEHLLRALSDAKKGVRMSAAEALGKIGDTRAAGPLRTAREDDEFEVRSAARTALRAITGKDED